MHLSRCLCEAIPSLDLATRVVLVMHCREVKKTTATGPLALATLPNSELHVHGERDRRLDLNPLFEDDRRVLLLYPSEGAQPLTPDLVEADPRPVTLVVPDGNWRQASRAAKRIPGLERAERVFLPEGVATEWGVRVEPKQGGLATFEAIARSLGIIESVEVQECLETLFRKMVDQTMAMRGYPPKAGARRSSEALSILFEDDHLVCVNKPSAMLVHRGWARDGRPAMQILRDQLGEWVYPVHRLDRATSGALLFAKSPEVARQLRTLFDEGAVDKRYVALCRGRDPELVRVDRPLSKVEGGELRRAITEFRLLGVHGRYGLYEARPLTGRSHQIRRHLKAVSHPIIGDVRYGKGEHNRYFRETHGFRRLALHSHRLCFTHPRTGVRLEVEAPLPADFQQLLEGLGLASTLLD